jgi:hypothetical protein
MTDAEVYTYIVRQWTMECTVDRIMVSLICMGRPISKTVILAMVRRYVDGQTENRTYRAKA